MNAYPIAGVYAISNGPRDDLIEACTAALEGGARVLQYRDKTSDTKRRRREARALQALCARYRVPLIVNDDIELATQACAAGVHLGELDGDIAAARSRLGAGAIIGVSCYASLDRAERAVAAGANYIAFGAFFPSPTKPLARHASADILREAKKLGVPIVAIGGITLGNAPALIEAGADAIAVISALFDAIDLRAAARSFSALFEIE